MPLPAYPGGSAYRLATSGVFIPELWSDEVRRFRDQKFVATMYTKKVSFEGRKGDTLHLPYISRAAVNTKLPETPVTLQSRTESEFTMTIDQYKESSFMIEDILNIQSAYNLRREYTREAGYALARDMDNAVLALRAAVNNFAAQRIYNTVDGTLAGSASRPLDQAAILAAKEILDLADVPEEGRVLMVGVQQYNDLLTIDAFVRDEYVSVRPTETGRVGQIYGIPVIKTTQIGRNSATGYVNGTGAAAQPTPGVASSPYLPTQNAFTALPTTIGNDAAPVASAIMLHPEWAISAVQQSPKSESSRETLFLADAFVSSQLYGNKLYREDHAVVIHTRV